MKKLIKNGDHEFASTREIAEVLDKSHSYVMKNVKRRIKNGDFTLITNSYSGRIDIGPKCIEAIYMDRNKHHRPLFLLNAVASTIFIATYITVIMERHQRLLERFKKAS